MGIWKKLIGAALVFTVIMIQMVFAVGFGIAHIVLYALFGRNYCYSPLGTYLIVAGVVHLVRAAWILCCSTPTYVVERQMHAVGGSRERRSGIQQPLVVNTLDSCFSIFLFIWLIVGTIWLFSIDSDDCNGALWLGTFVLIIISWCLAAITCCCTCAIATATLCVHYNEPHYGGYGGKSLSSDVTRVDYGSSPPASTTDYSSASKVVP